MCDNNRISLHSASCKVSTRCVKQLVSHKNVNMNKLDYMDDPSLSLGVEYAQSD